MTSEWACDRRTDGGVDEESRSKKSTTKMSKKKWKKKVFFKKKHRRCVMPSVVTRSRRRQNRSPRKFETPPPASIIEANQMKESWHNLTLVYWSFQWEGQSFVFHSEVRLISDTLDVFTLTRWSMKDAHAEICYRTNGSTVYFSILIGFLPTKMNILIRKLCTHQLTALHCDIVAKKNTKRRTSAQAIMCKHSV